MNAGRLLIATGLAIAGVGLLVMAAAKLHIRLGRLPGDIVWHGVWHGKNTTVCIPWVTCLILSVLGTLFLWVLNRRR